MPDDLLIVLLCELGERIIAMRETLAEPTVAAKPPARAVAALLSRGLDALETRLQRDVLASAGRDDPAGALRTLDACGRAFGELHRRLGLLEMRWSAAAVDIFLRKLREDVGELPHPAVVLRDEYVASDDDVAARLRADLSAAGLPAGDLAGAEAVISLPRLECANPLVWPLLLPALARLQPHPLAREGEEAAVAARLAGPAAFAACAAQALLCTPAEQVAWPPLAALAEACGAYTGALEEESSPRAGFATAGPISLFTRLLGQRDRLLGLNGMAPPETRRPDGTALPEPLLPTAAETSVLLDKLAAGTPINAIEPPLPSDFVQRLDGVRDAAGFYELIGPLGEQPASLATILGVGWLFKIRYSYPLFAACLRDAGAMGSFSEVLAAYRPHMLERNDLLLQSIEAAHVQGIFLRGRMDE